MRLNGLSPAAGSRTGKKRVGRGIGSGIGKTGGRGHKGLKSRSGGSVKPGFEGGQMPLQRRLPKFGFTSQKSLFRDEIRLAELNKIQGSEVTMETLRQARLIAGNIKDVKIILAGEIVRPMTIKGLKITKGAQAAVEAAGGKVEA